MRYQYWMIILVLVATNVAAETFYYNSTIAVDWIGSNQFYVRTEGGDFLQSSDNQTDNSFMMNFTRTRDYNLTGIDVLVLDLNKTVFKLTESYGSYNYSKMYADEKAAHERLIVAQEACEKDTTFLRLTLANYTNDGKSGLYDVAVKDRDNFMDLYNTYLKLYQNTTQGFQTYQVEHKNDVLNGALGASIVAVIIYLIMTYGKKKRQQPDEMPALD